MPKKKTHEEYVAEVAIINPNIDVIGKYVNAKTKVLHRCKIDGCEWDTTPDIILHGHGCPICAGNKKYIHEEYVEKVANVNSNIEVVDKYIDSFTNILHRCKIDGYEWEARPSSILYGSGCPKCAKINSTAHTMKTHESYVEELKIKNPFVLANEEYINAKTKIEHICLKCEYKWTALPFKILEGQGCPKCKDSKGEKNVSYWLDANNIMYIRQKTFDDCRDKNVLRFDFYLPNYNVLIEYQGKQHYVPVDHFGGKESFCEVVKRDKIKEEYCKKNNIPLFTIPYYADVHEELNKMYELIIDNEVIV